MSSLECLHSSLHVFVAVQLSLQHIWWEPNIFLKKVWTNPLFIWSFVGLQIGICLWLLVLFKNAFDDLFVWWDWKYYRLFSKLNIIHFFSSSYFFSCLHIPADALASLKQSCEFVCPNDGFLEQVSIVIIRCNFPCI